MRQDILKNFDMVMANLKAIEPSPAFEFEFQQRLRDQALKAREELPLAKFFKLAFESIRYVIIPEMPALVRVAASFAVVFSIGIYIYGAQPLCPISVSGVGIVTVQTAGVVSSKTFMPGNILKAGDIITTGSGGQIDISLSGKYSIRIKGNSSFKIAKLTPRLGHGTAAFKLAGGTALIDIEKGFKGSKFIIDTDAGRAVALGTKFSVDVSRDKSATTDIAVVEGKVKVSSNFKPKKMLLASNTVYVGPGQKTEMAIGRIPDKPDRIMAEEWSRLEELYRIGKKPQVVLMIKNTPDRVKQLLAPCAIYISDEKPRDIPEEFELAVRKIEEALKSGDDSKHLDAIKLLENMVNEHPSPKYGPQFLLYIGSYYEYMEQHAQAVKAFERVLDEYPNSPFASIAQAAIGVIYKEKIKDEAKAGEAFRKVLKNYPDSLEAIFVKEELEVRKTG